MADPFVSRDRSSALFTDEKCIRGAISDAGQPLLGDPARRGVAWTTQRRQQARGIERQVIGTIPKVVTSVLMCARVRFFYCFASDELDQTAELVKIGRQPRRAPGDAAGQPLPAAVGTVTFAAATLTLTAAALPDHATTLRAYRKAAGGNAELAGTSGTTTVSVVELGPLTAGVTYEFWLVGRNSQGEGPQSNHVTHVAT